MERARSIIAARNEAKAAQVEADRTAGAYWLVREEIWRAADELKSLATDIRGACRRGDDDRVHAYFRDIVRVGAELRSADGRLSALEKLGGGK
jgi:hypothetical protein